MDTEKQQELVDQAEQQATVLVVDDEKDALIILNRTLESEYKILSAENGKQAIELLQNNQVDAVVSDQRMPEMSGVDLLVGFRESSGSRAHSHDGPR